jgi:phage tail sheath protein FI
MPLRVLPFSGPAGRMRPGGRMKTNDPAQVRPLEHAQATPVTRPGPNPEGNALNIRRYLAYLEHSLEVGTQWVVFEDNSELLWGAVRRTVADFLFDEWKSGALLGSKPEEAYFVRCDRSTMTQNDLDNGRLVCLVGVAPVKPAEFITFRIGQWTADHTRNTP